MPTIAWADPGEVGDGQGLTLSEEQPTTTVEEDPAPPVVDDDTEQAGEVITTPDPLEVDDEVDSAGQEVISAESTQPDDTPASEPLDVTKIHPALSVYSSSVSYPYSLGSEELTVTLCIDSASSAEFQDFLDAYNPSDVLITFASDGSAAPVQITSADLQGKFNEAYKPSTLFISYSFKVSDPCSVSISVSQGSFYDSYSTPFTSQVIYKRLPCVDLTPNETKQIIQIIGDISLNSITISAAEIRNDGAVTARKNSVFPAGLQSDFSFNGFDPNIDGNQLDTYVGIPGLNSIQAVAATEGIASSGGSLYFTVHCVDVQNRIYEFDVVIQNTVALNDPGIARANSAEAIFVMALNGIEMSDVVWSIDVNNQRVPAYTDPDDITWVRSSQFWFYFRDGDQECEIGTALAPDGTIEPASLLTLAPVGFETDDALYYEHLYVRNPQTGEVAIINDGEVQFDLIDPELISLLVIPSPAHSSAQDYLGYDPNKQGGTPSLQFVFKYDRSGAMRYRLTYQGNNYLSGSFINGDGEINRVDRTWTVDISLKSGDHIYKLSDFSLTIFNFAGRWNTYNDLSLLDQEINKEEVQVIVIDSSDPIVDVSFSSGGTENFSSNQDMTITIDGLTMSVLQAVDPSRTIATISSEGGSQAIPASAFTAKDPTDPDYGDWSYSHPFNGDGSFQVQVSFEDFLGHSSNSYSRSFIIDTLPPIVMVTFDNNESSYGNYYNAPRTATVRVLEKNFDPAGVAVAITANDDAGQAMTPPSISGWASTGESEHEATIYFAEELHYTLAVSVTDIVGLSGESFAVPEFIIDMTPPEITVEGLRHTEAFSGEIYPVITFKDAHFDDYAAQVNFSLANGQSTYLFRADAFYDGTTKTISVDDISRIPENDNVYIMQATVTDRAGNTTTETRMFSINRFGSTYLISAETRSFLDQYIDAPKDVVITEINPSGLKEDETLMRLSRNVESVETLQEGRGYRVEPGSTDELWNSYVYTIPDSRFIDDGHYRVIVRSEDLANNISDNTMENKSFDRMSRAEINFALDRTLPTGSILNAEDGATYIGSSHDIQLRVEDNLGWDHALLMINGREMRNYTAEGEELSAVFTYTLEERTDPYDIELIIYDKAGNRFLTQKSGILITSDTFVEIVENPVLFNSLVVGVIISLVAISAVVVSLIALKRRHDKRQVIFNKTGRKNG